LTNKPFYTNPLVLLILAVIVSSLSLALALKYLLPLIIGIAIAFLIEPAVSFLERKTKLDRSIVSGFVVITIFVLTGYIIILIIRRLTFELSGLIRSLPNYNYYYEMIIDKLSSYLFYYSTKIPEELLIYLKTNLREILSTLTGVISNIYSLLMKQVGVVPHLIIDVIIIVIFTFLFSYFISKEKNTIMKVVKNLVSKTLQDKIKILQMELILSFFRLLKAQIFLVLITTFITIIGFYILRVKYALTIGIICGILDILPLFGPSLIFIPWIIFSLIMGNIKFTMGLLALYVITIVSRQILQAKVIGANLGLHPILTLTSIYLGVQIFGFAGLFIGPLVVVIVKTLIQSGIIPPIFKSNS